MGGKNKVKLNNKQHIDRHIVLIVAGLCIFGTVMVFSASYYDALNSDGSPYVYLIRQLMWLAFGTVLMIIFTVTDYHFLVKFWRIIFLAGLVLLIAVKIPGIGTTVNGATRWIYIGPISIMPGECAKVGIIFFIAGFLKNDPKKVENFVKGILPVGIACAIYAGLIMLQPNMSTAATVVLIAAGMLVAAGMKWGQFFCLSGIGILIGVCAILTSGYRRARAFNFIHPFDDALGNGYQVVQGLLALGSGGIFGKGIGNSVQKNLYLPEPMNDFITAIIGEELGLVGLLILITVYVLLIYYSMKVAMNAEDFTGFLLATGVTAMIGIQVVINLAVVTSSMPPTGVILPFVSYGGNALLIFMSLTGMVLNISKQQKR